MITGKKVFGLTAMAMAMLWGAPAMGGLVSNMPVAGETTLLSVWDGTTVVGTVDWLVLNPGDYTGTDFAPLVMAITGGTTLNSYLYNYQIESNILDGELFSVNVGATSNVLSAGMVNMDLDAVGHDAAHFANLAGEAEVAGAIIQAGSGFTSGSNNYTWDYASLLDTGEESEVNWFLSDLAPTMSNASYADSIPPSPGIGMVASVVPSPGVLALIGLAGLAGTRRRRG